MASLTHAANPKFHPPGGKPKPASKPKATKAPKVPGKAPSAGGAKVQTDIAQPMPPPVTPDPRDGNYLAQMAKLQFQRTTGKAAINQEQTYADADLSEALRRKAINNTDNIANARNSANKQGLTYSGALGKNLGDIGSQYTNDVADTNSAYERASAGRSGQLAAIDTGGAIDDTAAYEDAVGRQRQEDIDNPPPVPVPVGGKLATDISGVGGNNAILAKLHNLNQQAKQSKNDPNALKNIATMYSAIGGSGAPAMASALRKYAVTAKRQK